MLSPQLPRSAAGPAEQLFRSPIRTSPTPTVTPTPDGLFRAILGTPQYVASYRQHLPLVRRDFTPTPTPTPTPNPSAVRTLILVNRTQLVQLHGESAVAPLMNKLAELAQHPQVRGEIIRLDNNTEVSAAYAVWLSDLGNADKANQLASAIRAVVVNYLNQRSGVEYLVLVGDDRALPMRRIPDQTPRVSEANYKYTDAGNPTGAALKANHFLSDD